MFKIRVGTALNNQMVTLSPNLTMGEVLESHRMTGIVTLNGRQIRIDTMQTVQEFFKANNVPENASLISSEKLNGALY